ncbi:hypothetical protein SCP_1102650 [Sparassis crispa]|uniref:Alpha/beta hydrolase fold-3 domain-containing protein n=1 Tax=Sparassis crispa TaxID=139825 RepID=A0A401GZK8_9APHY|nr:hypothetical protein SCP_1102650 [Sparassis crispa]GBE87588.1 hypothetical protein SCP_1102650 [Sparassis crispa]
MVYWLQNEPWKTLYTSYASAKYYLIDAPLRTIFYAPSFLRPRPSWSFQKCMIVPQAKQWSAFGDVVEHVGNIRTWPTHRAIPDDATVAGVWVDPAPALLTEELLSWARAGSVDLVRIPGYWITTDGAGTDAHAAPGEKVIYYLHGGGYISESAHPSEFMSTIPRAILRRSLASRAFSVEFRLTNMNPLVPPEERNPFPAALLDALAGYAYLVDTLGFRPEDIIVVGDSAGGHLALSLARYIAQNTAHLRTTLEAFRQRDSAAPPDYHLILLSPWADMGMSHYYHGGSEREFYYDFLGDPHEGLLAEVTRVLTAPLGADAVEHNPYLSPASRNVQASFSGFPRTFIAVGDAERLYDQVVTLRDKIRADIGEEKVGWFVGRDAVHDYLLFPFEAEQTAETLNAIEKWLKE